MARRVGRRGARSSAPAATRRGAGASSSSPPARATSRPRTPTARRCATGCDVTRCARGAARLRRRRTGRLAAARPAPVLPAGDDRAARRATDRRPGRREHLAHSVFRRQGRDTAARAWPPRCSTRRSRSPATTAPPCWRAHPVDVAERGGKVAGANLYHGPLSTFLAAGFTVVARPTPSRPVVRLELRALNGATAVSGRRRCGCRRAAPGARRASAPRGPAPGPRCPARSRAARARPSCGRPARRPAR